MNSHKRAGAIAPLPFFQPVDERLHCFKQAFCALPKRLLWGRKIDCGITVKKAYALKSEKG